MRCTPLFPRGGRPSKVLGHRRQEVLTEDYPAKMTVQRWINWSLNAIDTIETWVSGNLTALTESSQPAIRWRVGEVANRVSGGSFRGGHWYLPIRNHDNRYFADWIRLCPGLSNNSENGNSCPKPHKAARMIEAVGRAVSIEHWDYNRNMDSTKEKFTALQREID